MKDITMEDCGQLRKRFEAYLETAEQYQFTTLLAVDLMMQHTIKKYEAEGIKDQTEARSMFRVVLKVRGEPCADYEEKTDE